MVYSASPQQTSVFSTSLAQLDDSTASLRDEAVELETREVDRLKNLENRLQDTISKLQKLEEEGSTTTTAGRGPPAKVFMPYITSRVRFENSLCCVSF